MNNLRSYARLTFSTSTGNSLVIDDANDCILAVTTCKEISNPNGVFSIILSPRIAKQLTVNRGSLLISDLIRPYDLVQIEFKVDGTGYHTEMVGLVTRAAVSLSIGEDGKPQRVIKIDGFDFGMALKNFKIYFSPFITSRDLRQFGGQLYFGKNNKIFRSNNPKEFIQNFVNLSVAGAGTPGPGQIFYPLTFNNGLKLTDYMDFYTNISTAFDEHRLVDPFILTNIQANVEQSVYDIVKFYSDLPYHEVFMDLRRPGKDSTGRVWTLEEAEATHKLNPLTNQSSFSSTSPTSGPGGQSITPKTGYQPYVFTMRTSPFSEGMDSWDGLSSHTYSPTDIIDIDVSTSEQNVFNYFDVVCERQSFALGDNQEAYVSEQAITKDPVTGNDIIRFPIQDQDSVNRFGIKRFPYHNTKYVTFIQSANHKKTKGKSTFPQDNLFPLKQIRSLARQLFRWFSFGETFESGVVSFKGRVGVGPSGLTMGSRLVELGPNSTPTGKEYYIESVMQEFRLGSPLKSTASVTRGHYPKDWTDPTNPNKTLQGRFSKVKQTEIALHIDQQRNSQYFNPIDDGDF